MWMVWVALLVVCVEGKLGCFVSCLWKVWKQTCDRVFWCIGFIACYQPWTLTNITRHYEIYTYNSTVVECKSMVELTGLLMLGVHLLTSPEWKTPETAKEALCFGGERNSLLILPDLPIWCLALDLVDIFFFSGILSKGLLICTLSLFLTWVRG